MSNEAITWALAQKVERSSAKFVLVAMANCAGADMICWPSIPYLVEATCQDRKTVMENMRRLRESGFITPTGEHKGRTGQVPVYALNGTGNGSVKTGRPARDGAWDPTADIAYGRGVHYLYRLTNPATGQFYVGVRTCVGSAADDDYMGSGRWPLACSKDGIALHKQVVSEHATRELAEASELLLIDASLTDPLCMNGPKTGTFETVPKTEPNSTVFPVEQSRFSLETVPETVPGTLKEPKEEPKGNPKKKSAPPIAPPPTVAVLVDAGFDEATAEEFIACKAERKAPLTARAWTDHLRESAKAGWTPMAAAEKVMAKTWKGFESKYVEGERPGGRGGGGNGSSKHSGFAMKNYREGIDADGALT